jgi:hypothetical protein
MKFYLKLILEVLIAIACIAISILLFEIIYNSDIPTWLKWLLLSK